MSLMSMTVTSYTFLIFIAVFMVIYYLMPKKKYQWVLMLAANFFFYVCACSKIRNAIIQICAIVFTSVLTYCATRLMQRFRDQNTLKLASFGEGITKEQKKECKKELQKKIKRVQVITIIIELACLALVKYVKGAVEDFNTIFDTALPEISILAPLGISFYTFASLGYVLDVARGKYAPEKNYLKVLTFLSFFPSIVQGPINRFDDVGKQLFEEHHFDYDRLVKGAELMLWGFFKKLVIADRAVNIVTTIFASDYKQFCGSQFLFAATVYYFQIYCDFSGGIDICRGAAEILGIDLPLNFERPTFSLSVTEFWRRWHMTLGGWMRDYVFYPVMLSKPVLKLSQKFSKRFGKFAGKMVPSVITPAVVFFLMGIWHGATFQYLAYAVYYAAVTSGSVAFEGVFKKIKKVLHINDQAFSYKVFCMLRVFALTSVSRIIVKAPRFRAIPFIFKSIFTNFNADFLFNLDGNLFKMGLDAKNMLILFLAILILATVSILQENGIHIRDSLNKQNIAFRWFILIALFVIVLIFGQYGQGYDASSFIYQAY